MGIAFKCRALESTTGVVPIRDATDTHAAATVRTLSHSVSACFSRNDAVPTHIHRYTYKHLDGRETCIYTYRQRRNAHPNDLFVPFCGTHGRARVDRDQTAKRDGADEALYLDRILDSAAEGAVSLLRELPREHLGSLRLMLNQPIPSLARLDIWRLLLKHTSVKQTPNCSNRPRHAPKTSLM